jgi:hypothetical protein
LCAYDAIRDPAALPDAQVETTDRHVPITENVPLLRIDHISTKGVLLGVWQLSGSSEREVIVENDERLRNGFWKSDESFPPLSSFP